MNKRPITEHQKQHHITPETEQLGSETAFGNTPYYTWGCLAYGWTDKIHRDHKCSDRGYMGIWVGLDSKTSSGHRIIPITRVQETGKIKLHPTRVSVTTRIDERYFPLRGEDMPQASEDWKMMDDEEAESFLSKHKTESEKENETNQEMEEGEYEIDDIVDHKSVNYGKKGMKRDLFRVRWKGYDEDTDSWVRESDLFATEKLQKYKEHCGMA